jgi:glycosyltransferase involved in cell wall biosynthesis
VITAREEEADHSQLSAIASTRSARRLVNPPSTPLVALALCMPLGGSSTFLVNLARAFHHRGLLLPVVVLSEVNDFAADFAGFGGSVKMISRRRHIYEDRLRLAYAEVARWRPRAVLASLGPDSFEVLRVAPPGCARIGMIQSHEPSVYSSVVYGPWLDAMVGVSAEICSHLSTLPEFSRCRIERIPYGIPFPEATARSAPNPDQPLRVIYVGRIVEEQKRVSRLVELVRFLEQRGENFRFTFVGSGPQLPGMQSALAASRLVEFAGAVPHHDVQRLLAAHDVFILLSDYEGLPLSLLEAMGQGVVPVASDLASGIREVVTDDCGIRVPVGDVRGAAEALVALSRDRQRLAAMGAAASALARRNFGADRMAAQFLELVDALAPGKVEWPADVRIPTPFGMRPRWMFSGLPRRLRRLVKRAGHTFLPVKS